MGQCNMEHCLFLPEKDEKDCNCIICTLCLNYPCYRTDLDWNMGHSPANRSEEFHAL